MNFWIESAIDEELHRLADGRIGEGGMLRLRRGALAVDLLVRIGRVQQDEFEVVGVGHLDPALAARLEALQLLVLDLHVPGVIVFARLQHGARGRDGVAAALHLDVSK